MLDRDQVLHVARLARLELTEDEVERMAAELSKVLDHIEKIGELDLDGVPPTSHVVDVVERAAARRAAAVPAPRSDPRRRPRAARGRLRRPQPRRRAVSELIDLTAAQAAERVRAGRARPDASCSRPTAPAPPPTS